MHFTRCFLILQILSGQKASYTRKHSLPLTHSHTHTHIHTLSHTRTHTHIHTLSHTCTHRSRRSSDITFKKMFWNERVNVHTRLIRAFCVLLLRLLLPFQAHCCIGSWDGEAEHALSPCACILKLCTGQRNLCSTCSSEISSTAIFQTSMTILCKSFFVAKVKNNVYHYATRPC